jgi:hypothetical protein
MTERSQGASKQTLNRNSMTGAPVRRIPGPSQPQSCWAENASARPHERDFAIKFDSSNIGDAYQKPGATWGATGHRQLATLSHGRLPKVQLGGARGDVRQHRATSQR